MNPFSDTSVSFEQLRRAQDMRSAVAIALPAVTLALMVSFLTALACLGLPADPAAFAGS